MQTGISCLTSKTGSDYTSKIGYFDGVETIHPEPTNGLRSAPEASRSGHASTGALLRICGDHLLGGVWSPSSGAATGIERQPPAAPVTRMASVSRTESQ